MTLQHLLHPRMVFTYALDTAFQDIGVAAILGVTFGLFTGGVFASLAFFFRILLVGLQHFQRGIQVLLFSFPSYYIFLACTFVDFAPPHLLFFPRSASRLRPSSLWIWPRA